MVAFTLGNVLILLVALTTSIGPYAADWNETHIYNPNWMPHCKFHNGQTMTMGLLLGVLTIWYTFRSAPATSPSKGAPQATALTNQKRREDVNTAGILAALYWVTQASGILYPGSRFLDPPEEEKNAPQPYLIVILLSMTAVGWGMEKRRIPV